MIPSWLTAINTIAWVTSNLLVIYIAILLVIFTIFYYVVFDTKATTAGRFIFRFVASLVGVIGLVFIGSFIDPNQGSRWFQYPVDVSFWRPLVRLVVYGYVAFSVTALVVLLAIRKWWPERIQTAADRDIIKPRRHDIT